MVCYHTTTSLSRHWFKCPSKLSTPLFCLTMLLSNHSPEHRLKALVYAQVDSLMGQKGKQLPNKIKDTLTDRPDWLWALTEEMPICLLLPPSHQRGKACIGKFASSTLVTAVASSLPYRHEKGIYLPIYHSAKSKQVYFPKCWTAPLKFNIDTRAFQKMLLGFCWPIDL